MKTFEEYLRDLHAETYTGIDDDMYDNFVEWSSSLTVEELLVLAARYMGKMLQESIITVKVK